LFVFLLGSGPLDVGKNRAAPDRAIEMGALQILGKKRPACVICRIVARRIDERNKSRLLTLPITVKPAFAAPELISQPPRFVNREK
jgi:hypothetical protein